MIVYRTVCIRFVYCADHLVGLHSKLNFVITELFALAVCILDLLQMFHSLLRGQVHHIGYVFLSQLVNLSFFLYRAN